MPELAEFAFVGDAVAGSLGSGARIAFRDVLNFASAPFAPKPSLAGDVTLLGRNTSVSSMRLPKPNLQNIQTRIDTIASRRYYVKPPVGTMANHVSVSWIFRGE